MAVVPPDVWQITDEKISIAVASIAVLLSFIVSIVGATWALSRSGNKLYEKVNLKLEADKDELATRLNEIDAKFSVDIKSAERNFGETVSAIRQKVSDVELWGRDNYVTKNTFNMVISEIKDSWLRLEEKIDRRFDKLDNKIDTLPKG